MFPPQFSAPIRDIFASHARSCAEVIFFSFGPASFNSEEPTFNTIGLQHECSFCSPHPFPLYYEAPAIQHVVVFVTLADMQIPTGSVSYKTLKHRSLCVAYINGPGVDDYDGSTNIKI